MPDVERTVLYTIKVDLKAVLITTDGDHLITKAKTFMVKDKNGDFVTHYVDRYKVDGKDIILDRIDRKNNCVYYRELE